MKKVFKPILIVLIMCCMCFTLVACGSKLKTPSSDAEIIGNGGLAVQKGDYIYFANGYQAYSVITKSNRKSADYVRGGLYVAHLDANGNVETDEDGNIKYVKRMVGNLVGYENVDLHIFGNYLYFNTPCTNLTEDGSSVASDLIRFSRIKLDGTDRTTLYTSDTSSAQYGYYYDGSKVNLIVYENNKLVRVVVGGKTTTIAEDVTGVVFPEVFGDPMNDQTALTHIMYTAELSDDDKDLVSDGNKLMQYNLKTNTHQTILMQGYTAEIKAVTSSAIYVTFDSDNLIYKLAFTQINGHNAKSDFARKTAIAYDNVHYLSQNTATGLNGLIAYRNDRVYFLADNAEPTNEQLVRDGHTIILKIVGSDMYYTDSTGTDLYRLNITDALLGPTESETLYSGDMTATFDNTHIDIQVNNAGVASDIYLMLANTNSNGTSTYAYHINLNYQDENNEYTTEFVGVYLKADIPDKEEGEED